MRNVDRKWSEAQKLQMIQEAAQNGQTETLRTYNFEHSLFSEVEEGVIEGCIINHKKGYRLMKA